MGKQVKLEKGGVLKKGGVCRVNASYTRNIFRLPLCRMLPSYNTLAIQFRDQLDILILHIHYICTVLSYFYNKIISTVYDPFLLLSKEGNKVVCKLCNLKFAVASKIKNTPTRYTNSYWLIYSQIQRKEKALT